MPKPIAVIINDVHYNLNTLEVADNAMNQAIDKANSLDIPLIVAGDIHDSKANLRAECVNRMLETFAKLTVDCFIIVGNHDLINEKSEDHSLNFLDHFKEKVHVVNIIWNVFERVWLVPYCSNPTDLRKFLKDRQELLDMKQGVTLVMHQGLTSSNSGEYIQDKSAINPEDVAGMRVISGHYHTRQDIELPDGGLWSYTGNPYTLNFAESRDPEKGYHVLMDDGTLEFIPTNLRKHIVVEISISNNGLGAFTMPNIKEKDIVWVKVTGSKENLSKMTKDNIALLLDIKQGFKLDLIPLAGIAVEQTNTKLSQVDQLDLLIDRSNSSEEGKKRLKTTWREML